MNNKKKSTWKYYLVLAVFPLISASCGDGCIQLSACNILPGGPITQVTDAVQDDNQATDTSIEDMIRDIGK